MRKEQIQEIYKIAHQYTEKFVDDYELEDIVQLAIQMTLNQEVLLDEQERIIRIE